MTEYIADIDHYFKVIAQFPQIKRLLWIATADLKDSKSAAEKIFATTG